MATRLDRHHPRHHHAEREHEAHNAAGAGACLHWTRPPQPFDRRAHHVHADASPRQVGDVGRRREARHEYQVNRRPPRSFRRRCPRRQTALDGRPADALRVDPSTVVLDFNDDMFASRRARSDGGDRGLSRGGALGAGSTP